MGRFWVVHAPEKVYAQFVVRKYAVLVGVVCLSFASSASADIVHTVARGHTLDAIAHRYHVSSKSIIDANHLRDPNHLRVGQSLTIPGVTATPTPAAGHGTATPGHATVATAVRPTTPVTYAARAKTPGVIHLKRIATAEDSTVRVTDRRGRMPPPTLHTMEHLMRYPNGLTHAIDPRLISLLGLVSDHFGSRNIEIISGFRPYSPTQYTAHSNHNVGNAVDFRVTGVPNEVVRDFCRTLRNTGCGYYPNSVFVHMDTRASSAYWVDYSRPGEPPRYNGATPPPDADEGTSDVGDESHLSNTAPEPNGSTTNGAPPGSDLTPMTDPSAPAQ
jgi:uncharacterized protein YcbK (DUF882 family)